MVMTTKVGEPVWHPTDGGTMRNIVSSERMQSRTYAVAAPAAQDTVSLLAVAAVMAVSISLWTSATLTSLTPLLLR
jgi:hypothetical protein